ncbi:MAG: hypothetical protein JWN24_2889 [Phycisphaerales bacterium]|nr:hypothetical protein [Phycisphaerales bacterium]
MPVNAAHLPIPAVSSSHAPPGLHAPVRAVAAGMGGDCVRGSVVVARVQRTRRLALDDRGRHLRIVVRLLGSVAACACGLPAGAGGPPGACTASPAYAGAAPRLDGQRVAWGLWRLQAIRIKAVRGRCRCCGPGSGCGDSSLPSALALALPTGPRRGPHMRRLRLRPSRHAGALPGMRNGADRCQGERMRRRVFTLLSALSLLLCAGACVLWARGYVVADGLYFGFWHFHPHPDYPGFVAARAVDLGSYRGGWRVGLFTDVCVGVTSAHRTTPDGSVHHLLYRRGDAAEPPRTATLGFRHIADGRRKRWSEWYVPAYAPAGVSLVMPAGWCIARFRRGNSRSREGCRTCGYDLRATPDRCPECGTETKIPAGSAGGE